MPEKPTKETASKKGSHEEAEVHDEAEAAKPESDRTPTSRKQQRLKTQAGSLIVSVGVEGGSTAEADKIQRRVRVSRSGKSPVPAADDESAAGEASTPKGRGRSSNGKPASREATPAKDRTPHTDAEQSPRREREPRKIRAAPAEVVEIPKKQHTADEEAALGAFVMNGAHVQMLRLLASRRRMRLLKSDVWCVIYY